MHDMRNDFRVALYSGDYAQAERLANNQLALLGESSLWLNEMGILLVSQGRLAEALLHFDRAATADSSNLEAILNGAVVLADLGFYSEAAQRFEAARAIESGTEGDTSPPVVPLSEGKTTALKLAEKSLEIAKIFVQLGNFEKAEAEIRHALSIQENQDAFFELAKVFIQKGEPEKALDALEQARQRNPSNPEIYVLAAQCHIMNKHSADAEDALVRAELLEDKSHVGALLRRSIKTNALS
jgi:tetratricopeptide (TPR) repeat protein